MDMNKSAVSIAVLVAILAGLFLLLGDEEEQMSDTVPEVFTSQSQEASRADQEGALYTNASGALIQISLPLPGGTTGRDFVVRGTAAKEWFEDSAFAIAVLDDSGNVLYEGVAKQDGSALNNDHLSFAADIYLPNAYMGPATLILAKGQVGDLETGTYIVLPIQVEP